MSKESDAAHVAVQTIVSAVAGKEAAKLAGELMTTAGSVVKVLRKII